MVLALYVKSQPPASMLYQLSYLGARRLLAPADAPAGTSGPAHVRLLGVSEVEPLHQGHALSNKLRVDAREVVELLREAPAGEGLPDLVDAQLEKTQFMPFRRGGINVPLQLLRSGAGGRRDS